MKKFDLRKMIAENKATFFASLNEGDLIKNIGLGLDYEATEEKIRDYAEHLREESPYDVEELAQLYLNEPRSFPSQLDYDFFKNNYDDILSVAMTGLNEGEAAYEYEKGKEAGEAIEKKKMKKSELKAKIKEMIVAEMDGAAVVDSEYDFLKEIDGIDINDPALMKARAAAHQRTLPKSPTPKPTTAEKNAGKINLLKRLKAQYLKFMEMEPEGGPMTDLYNLGTEAIEKIDKSIAKLSGEKNVAESKYDFLKEIEDMLNESEGLTPLQQYLYDYEMEISDEDFADKELDNIKKLNTLEDVYDYYATYRGWLQDKDFKYDLKNLMKTLKKKFGNLNEAEGDEEVDAEAAADAGAEEEVDTTVDVTTNEVDPNVKAVQDALTQAQAAAQQLGDKKLMDQIGNTITFFTRAHVVEKPGAAVAEELNESIFPILKRILK